MNRVDSGWLKDEREDADTRFAIRNPARKGAPVAGESGVSRWIGTCHTQSKLAAGGWRSPFQNGREQTAQFGQIQPNPTESDQIQVNQGNEILKIGVCGCGDEPVVLAYGHHRTCHPTPEQHAGSETGAPKADHGSPLLRCHECWLGTTGTKSG
jgi:hypothetical protein